MAAEFFIAGRRELPKHDRPWRIEIENAEGGIEVYEDNDRSYATKILGWTPKSVVRVRKAWELGQVVAEELACALEGAVFCDVDGEVFFDAAGKASPETSIDQLEARLRHAFNHPESFFARWNKQEKARFERDVKSDPDVADGNDWSDV